MEIFNETYYINKFSSIKYIKIKDYVDYLKKSYLDFDLSDQHFYKIAEILKMDKRKNVQNLGIKIINFIKNRKEELDRVKCMYNFDKQYINTGYLAGVDEVGRGPLAGPIVAAAVVLDLHTLEDKNFILGIKDSKKLSAKVREDLCEIIKQKAVSYSIGLIDSNIIDMNGIAWCNNEVFKLAINKLTLTPNFVLSDGYSIKNYNVKNEHVIKGDEKSASIACASIIAKVYRDNLMKEYSKIYPYYGFEENAGYGTKEHIDSIKKYGPCKIHRRCFLSNILHKN
ncbi:ribonuclease HII [Clostridium sp. SYSU_GA19001]|uniref:ribonuclease HII n=1 Tax=Clostridium caldaquaticum TaxID=2940653 RepID=UPI0020776C74|nr:ribonuclease HII [Clostridium caldaquaticum]MCM8710608.1 ribonuclease HII [Clostridium caldaquaticum]